MLMRPGAVLNVLSCPAAPACSTQMRKSYGSMRPLCCLLLALSGLRCSLAATAAQQTNIYQPIVDRNVFGLKPPPPPTPPQTFSPPPAKITITGITTILGDKRVLLKVLPASRPGNPVAPEQSYILAVGQRSGDLQILDVDEKSGDVTLSSGGLVVTLNIEKNGPKPPGSAPPLLRDLPPPPAAFPHPVTTQQTDVAPHNVSI